MKIIKDNIATRKLIIVSNKNKSLSSIAIYEYKKPLHLGYHTRNIEGISIQGRARLRKKKRQLGRRTLQIHTTLKRKSYYNNTNNV